jgi:hypothetical protein
MLIAPMRYILATERLQGPVFTALPGCRATALPLKRELAITVLGDPFRLSAGRIKLVSKYIVNCPEA